MKLFCSLLLLLLYRGVTGRPSDAQLLRQNDAPVSLQYSKIGDPILQLTAGTNSIVATWGEVSGASYYNISWTPDGNGPNTVDGTSSSGTYTYTILDLVSCTKYTVTVQPGNNDTDVGGPLKSSTTTMPHDPYPVTTVTVATVVGRSSQLAVSWTKAEDAGNCPVTYRVTWIPASGGGSKHATTSALSYTITGLAASTTYRVCVAASIDGGYYTNDRCSSGTTDVSSDPGLQLLSTTDSIEATWEEVPGASYYTISWSPNNGTNTVDSGSSNPYIYTISGLVSCTYYTVTVQPRDSVIDVGGPLTSSITTLARDPFPVTGVMVKPVINTPSQLSVSWSKAEISDGGDCAITYRITWKVTNGGQDQKEDTTSSLSYTIKDLNAYTSYTVCVAATTNKTYSDDKCNNGRTDEDKPGAVSSTVLKVLDDSSLQVQWTRPEKPNGVITQYMVKWTWEGGNSQYTVTAPTTGYTITGLAPCTRYSVTVTAATSKGFGDESVPKSVATDSIAPDPPKSLGAYMVFDESDKLSVNWTQPDDPGPLCPVTRYKVTWYLASTQELVGQTTSDTNLTISDLEAWTSYTVCVAAATEQNLIYKYSPSSCTNATTDQDTPGAPSDTRIESHTEVSLLVVWSPPEKPRGIITSYSVAWSPPDTGNGTEVTVDGSVTQYNITSLDTCVSYTVTVTAATCKGYGEQLNINNYTDGSPPPSPPVTCKKVVSPHQLTVTWPPVDIQCPVNMYKVNYTGDVLWSNNTQQGSKEVQTTYADLGDLTPWTTYTVCVAGVIVNDIVGAWDCCSSTTLEAAPGPPAALTIASVSSKTVTVSWAPPKELNGVLTGYQVVWDNGLSNLTANLTTYTVSDRRPKSQFNVTVKARTAAGWGPAAMVRVATADDGVNVGAVVGGVVGGLLLLALLVAAVFFRHKIMDTFQAAKHTRPPPAGPPPVTIVHPGDQVKKDVMTHDPSHKHALYSGSAVPRALREEVSPHKAPSVQSPGGLALNTVTTHSYSDHTYVNEISDEDDPIYMSLD